MTGVPVYIWRVLGGRLVRCPLESDEAGVSGYGINQRVYNALDNEWDCSTLFGELEPGEEAEMLEADILVAEPSGPCDEESMYKNLAAGLAELNSQEELEAEMLEADILVAEPSGPIDEESMYKNLAAGLAELNSQEELVHDEAPTQAEHIQSQSPPPSFVPEVDSVERPTKRRRLEEKEPGEVEENEDQPQTGRPPPTVPPHLFSPSSPTVRIAGPSRPTNSATYVRNSRGTFELEEYELVDLLMKNYGFRVPLHFPDSIPPPSTSGRNLNKMALDLGGAYHEEFFRSPVATLALDFWAAVSEENPSSAPGPYWDLSEGNDELLNTARLQFFRKLMVPMPGMLCPDVSPRSATTPDEALKLMVPMPGMLCPDVSPRSATTPDEALYVLNYGAWNTVPWQLGVYGVLDMLMVSRLPPMMTERGLLDELVNQGVQCQILYPCPTIPRELPPLMASISIRMAGYVFTKADYQSYEANTRALLQNPRIARAALLAGGILWRVALMFNASLGMLLNGSQTSATGAASFSYSSGTSRYRVDGLHLGEAHALCGLYYVYKNPLHREKVSWFPLPQTWDSRMKYGFWARTCETFFSKTLARYASGDNVQHPQPMSASRWAKEISQPSTVRRARKFITTSSNQFLAKHKPSLA
ncbi:hypothetical protein CVT24_012376 [Panaeolus cyanescens]|uniref:Uncharacterized protein n=1 Tax=Panaeolus cyanescens TaxID=181874 RepID=A0A409YYM5_9AGAR|nr:hypothetical protein CVT24_012376 [Panaeolus cyanescens]